MARLLGDCGIPSRSRLQGMAAVIALTVGAVVACPPVRAQDKPDKPSACLSVADDQAQIDALVALIDSTCDCAALDKNDYKKCVDSLIRDATKQMPPTLRPQCKDVVKRMYDGPCVVHDMCPPNQAVIGLRGLADDKDVTQISAVCGTLDLSVGGVTPCGTTPPRGPGGGTAWSLDCDPFFALTGGAARLQGKHVTQLVIVCSTLTSFSPITIGDPMISGVIGPDKGKDFALLECPDQEGAQGIATQVDKKGLVSVTPICVPVPQDVSGCTPGCN